MQIIQVDQQARSVVNLVLGAALLISGLVILLYRIFEPTQLQLYHTLSSSLLVAAIANGIAFLTFDLHSQKEWKALVSRTFAVVGVIASVDGLLGSVFDSFSAQLHNGLYITSGLVGLWLSLRMDGVWAIRIQKFLSLAAIFVMLTVLAMHFVVEAPLLARHPVGSLVSGSLVLMMLIGMWNLSTASNEALPCVSWLTTSIAVLGLLVSSVVGVVLFHNEMNELRFRGEDAANNLNLSRRAAGNQHVSTFISL